MTPHIEAKKGDIAQSVIMPGDPLRAKFIAENFLSEAKTCNSVRNMLGFTGFYKNKRVTVFASGMGCPSAGIYSYELFKFYGAQNIIRVGTAGALADDLRVGDIVLAQGASTNSNYPARFFPNGRFAPLADYGLLSRAAAIAERRGVPARVGNIFTSDAFYSPNADENSAYKKMGILAIEMECAALYTNAAYLGKKALGVLTVSDHIITGETATPKERQEAFTAMMEIALETAE